MSKSDHSKSRMDRFNDGDRMTRRHHLVSKREAITDSLADHVLPTRRLVTVAAHVDHPLVQPIRHTVGTVEPLTLGERLGVFGWTEHMLSDCEHGCKVYRREVNGGAVEQVQHSSTYGCPKGDDAPIYHGALIPADEPMPEWERELLTPTPVKHEPVRKAPKPRKHVQHVYRDRLIGQQDFRELSRGTNVIDAGDNVPSLMQIAQARAKTLGY